MALAMRVPLGTWRLYRLAVARPEGWKWPGDRQSPAPQGAAWSRGALSGWKEQAPPTKERGQWVAVQGDRRWVLAHSLPETQQGVSLERRTDATSPGREGWRVRTQKSHRKGEVSYICSTNTYWQHSHPCKEVQAVASQPLTVPAGKWRGQVWCRLPPVAEAEANKVEAIMEAPTSHPGTPRGSGTDSTRGQNERLCQLPAYEASIDKLCPPHSYVEAVETGLLGGG